MLGPHSVSTARSFQLAGMVPEISVWLRFLHGSHGRTASVLMDLPLKLRLASMSGICLSAAVAQAPHLLCAGLRRGWLCMHGRCAA
jgi:hypothetical protein